MCVLLLAACEQRDPGAASLQRGKELLGSQPDQALKQYELAEAEGANAAAVMVGKASALEALNKIAEAERLLVEVVEQHPGNIEARLALARIRIDSGRFDEARVDLESTLDSKPLHVPSILLYPALVNTPEAAAHGERALAKMTGAAYRQVRGSAEFAVATARLTEVSKGKAEAEATLKAAADSTSLSPRMALALAHAYLKVDQARYAEWLLARASADTSAPDYVHGELASVALNLGHLALAEQAISKMRTDFAPDPDALLLQARLFERQSRTGKSALAAKRALQALPEDATQSKRTEVAMDAVGKLLRAKKYKDAAKLCQTLLQESPDFVPAKVVLASLLVAVKKPDEALELLEPHLKHERQLEQIHETRIAALTLKGDATQLEQAAQQYFRASNQSPRAALALARMHEQAGRKAQANAVLHEAISRDPMSTPLIEALVGAATRRGGLAAGLQTLEKLRGKSPDGTLDRVQAKLHTTHEDHAAAATVYHKLVVDSPRDTQLWAELAIAQERNGQLDKAIGSLYTLLDISPYNTLVLLKLGTLESRAGNHESAREAYQRALDVEPNSVVALNNLAMLYAGPLRDPARAVTLARKAVAGAPNNPAAEDTLGWALCQTGAEKDLEEGLGLLQRSSRRLRSGDAYLRYAQALLKAGKSSDAEAQLEAAIAEKGFEELETARTLLAELKAGQARAGKSDEAASQKK